MKFLFEKLFGNRAARAKTPSISLRLEGLEERIVPTFTYHGGPLLTNVSVQALYLGSDWSNTSPGNPNPASTSYFDSYLQYLVNSPYMDMLHNAGYGVGRGTWTAGVIDPVTLTKGSNTTFLTDSTIRSDIQAEITAGKLQNPGPNNLYVVYVEDNVPVKDGSVGNTISNFAGYHEVFNGTDASGNPAVINYAVITVPGGTVGNIWPATNLSAAQAMNVSLSHRLAEAVTDPERNYARGWYDETLDVENGDLSGNMYVYLGKYAVQRITDLNDQPMTPRGAHPLTAETYILENNGNLYQRVGGTGNSTLIASNVASITNQSLSNKGLTVIGYVDTSGNAWAYDDLNGAKQIAFPNPATVVQAVASQGAGYFLLNNGQVIEEKYSEALGRVVWSSVAVNVASISGGSDKNGVSCVDYVTTSGAAYEYSDSTGVHLIKSSGVASVSAGQFGMAGVVLTTGEGDVWQESNNKTTVLASSGVKQITVGTNALGANLVERLDTNGNLWEYQGGLTKAPTQIQSGVTSISNPRFGFVDAILSNGTAQEHSDKTGIWSTIDSNTVIGVG